MKNEEHVEILKQGVDTWNKWREKNPEVIPELSGANLCLANLSGANLIGASLYKANLRGANLSEAVLVTAILYNADLCLANLSEANLVAANLNKAYLYNAELCGANLERAGLSEALLSETNFCGANLNGAILIEANLCDASLYGANLVEAKLNKAILHRANLVEAKLVEANLSRANLWEANLTGAKLVEANLYQANLWGANLNEANLSRANLSEACLITTQALAANFKEATLSGACIEDWHTNSSTILDGVVCEYVYLQAKQQQRLPDYGEELFAPGEFTKVVQTDAANRLTEYYKTLRKNQPNYIYELVVDRPDSRKLLIEALNSPTERLILVCPWLGRSSIKSDIFKKLRAFLEGGGCIHIGWGNWNDLEKVKRKLEKVKQKLKLHQGLLTRKQLLDNLDRTEEWKYDALSKFCKESECLEQLELDYPHQFKLKLLGTHEKYLVWVNSNNSWCMIGSHNFLTSSDRIFNFYTGDNHPNRERELGLKTNNPDIVNKLVKHFDDSPNLEE